MGQNVSAKAALAVVDPALELGEIDRRLFPAHGHRARMVASGAAGKEDRCRVTALRYAEQSDLRLSCRYRSRRTPSSASWWICSSSW